MKPVLKILLINGLILVGMLILLELIFRMIGFGFGYMPFEMDPVYRHVHPKNYEFVVYDRENNEFGGHKVIYDENRRRISEHPVSDDKIKSEIWFLGDSFTETKEVSWENSYVGQIDSKTNFKVLNYGTTAYFPTIYYIQLLNELKEGRLPELVFIQLYTNDISDVEKFERSTSFDELDRPVAVNGGQPSNLKKLLRKFYVMRVARRAQMTIEYMLQEDNNTNDKSIGSFIEQNDDWDSDHRFSKSIHQIHTLLDSVNIEHYFFAIPSKFACMTGDWESTSFANSFNRMAKLDSLPYIDLNPAFKNSKNPDELFFEIDIHCNEKGNELIALELLNKLNNR